MKYRSSFFLPHNNNYYVCLYVNRRILLKFFLKTFQNLEIKCYGKLYTYSSRNGIKEIGEKNRIRQIQSRLYQKLVTIGKIVFFRFPYK